MANDNIGHIKCPLSNKFGVVRADKRGKLYYFSSFGKITPNLPEGQEWLASNAIMWPDGIQPENVRLKTLYNGAPPIVTLSNEGDSIRDEKALTPQVEEKRVEKALTDEVVKPEPVSKPKKSAFELLADAWREDDE